MKLAQLLSFFILCGLTLEQAAFASKITVHNRITAQDASHTLGTASFGTIYARIYYYRSSEDSLSARDKNDNLQPIIEVESFENKEVERPDQWRYGLLWSYDRQLVFSFDKDKLKEVISKEEYGELGSVNVGSTRGYSFYIVVEEDKLTGYNLVSWNVIKPIKSVLDKARQIAKSIASLFKNNPYRNDVAEVRVGDELSSQEKYFLDKRQVYVKRALENWLGIPMQDKPAPTIAVVASGGGYRAMLGTIGSLAAAKDSGLFDAFTYLVGLSGSTWAIGGMFSYGLEPRPFKEKLLPIITDDIKQLDFHESELLGVSLLSKYLVKQSLTLVDIYGGLLANRLFGSFDDARHRVSLSQQRDLVNNGEWPLPIYSAVRRGVGQNTTWWEYTPFEVGSSAFGMYVPAWSFGRKFSQGRSTDFAPEQSFGYHLGTFGSAFAAEFKIIYGELVKSVSESYRSLLDYIVSTIDKKISGSMVTLGNKRIRLSWAEVNNFMAGMTGSPLANDDYIRLVDGGIDFNLPCPLVGGKNGNRKADIIILLDYSGDITKLDALRGCEKYAIDNKLKFPKIDYTDVDKRAVSIFRDGPSGPVVIYLPLIRDKDLWEANKDKPEFSQFRTDLTDFDPVYCEQQGFCTTSSFKYSTEQSQQLTSQTEFNFTASLPEIKRAIADWVEASSK